MVSSYKICFLWSIVSLNCQSISVCQPFQCWYILCGPPTNNFAWHFNGVVLQGHTTNKMHICTCWWHADTKLGKMLTYSERLPPWKTDDLDHKLLDNSKRLYQERNNMSDKSCRYTRASGKFSDIFVSINILQMGLYVQVI